MQTPAMLQTRDGILTATPAPGTDYWHPECSPPDAYLDPGATDDDCPACGAPAGEPCRPLARPADPGMFDPAAVCGPDGCGAKAGEPCKPGCRWAGK